MSKITFISNWISTSPTKIYKTLVKLNKKNYFEILDFFKKNPQKINNIIWQGIYTFISALELQNINIKNTFKIVTFTINQGPIETRKRPVSKGRAFDIQKKKSRYILTINI